MDDKRPPPILLQHHAPVYKERRTYSDKSYTFCIAIVINVRTLRPQCYARSCYAEKTGVTNTVGAYYWGVSVVRDCKIAKVMHGRYWLEKLRRMAQMPDNSQ